jgi:hypothetical protein
MNKQGVKPLFQQQLAPHLPGFRPRKKEGDFVRRIPGGVQTIGFSLVDWNPQFKVSLVFTIRLEEAEKTLHAVLKTPPKYQAMTITTATLLDYFFPGERDKEFTVTTPEGIAAVATELAPHLRDRIMPFLDAHQDAKSLDAVMNSEAGASFDQRNPPYRQMSSLILAHLAGNPRFDELAASYEKAAAAWHPDDRKNLAALVERLRAARA